MSYHRKVVQATPAKSRKLNTQTPVVPITSKAPAERKPSELLKDLKLRAIKLPTNELTVPKTFYTRDALAESSIVRGIDGDVFAHFLKGEGSIPPKTRRLTDAKLRLLTQGLLTETSNPELPNRLPEEVWKKVLDGDKDFLTVVNEARGDEEEKEEEDQPKTEKEVAFVRPSSPVRRQQPLHLAVPRPLETPSKKPRGRPPNTFRTPGPVRAGASAVHSTPFKGASTSKTPSLHSKVNGLLDKTMPPLPAEAFQFPPICNKKGPVDANKKSSLESLVNKLIHAKKQAIAVPPPSSSHSSPSLSADSSIDSSSSERKNKRKSSPYKVIDEAGLRQNSAGKVGKRKSNEGKKAPPLKKVKVDFDVPHNLPKDANGHRIEDAGIVEDDELPPRIVVVGQEPGTELEWDEEEIIVLRVGEQPEQRPPVMKRKKEPKEAESDATTPAEAGTMAMDDAVIEKEEGAASISMDACLPSVDSSLAIVSQSNPTSGERDSPIAATVSGVLGLMTEVIAEWIPGGKKREQPMESSTSSAESNGERRSKRATRTRARFSPSPEKVSPTSSSRALSKMDSESSGVNVNDNISPR